MKIKEVSATATIAWAPKTNGISSSYLACGTAAQQVDASFSSSSVIQVYDLNSRDDSLNMKHVSTISSPSKFHKLIWNASSEDSEKESGIIVGGGDNGSIYIHSAKKMLANEDSLIKCMEGKHSGPVFTMDFNSHQPNLLASGSSECDIIIWDINNPTSPMAPGAKPNITADVTGLAWNRQVEHIMASNYAGRCVVYDLRKSASIIQIVESVSRIKAHSVNWHPNVATQLILCSSDDSNPVSQIWDLRFAAAPLKSLEGHQKGIMSSMWCVEDPDIFITSGRDNRILVWNPNSSEPKGEIVGEFPSYNQWSFDMSWSRKDPSLVATSSIDGTVSVFSLIGAGQTPSQVNKFSAIADSFPGMEMPIEVPQPSCTKPIQLKRPPKWFASKSGASFGFGGRLISFGGEGSVVTLSQVVTEPEFVSRSGELEQALSEANFVEYCHNKSAAADQSLQSLWQFIGASFDVHSRNKYMELLGFDQNNVALQVRPEDMVQNVTVQELTEKMENFGGQQSGCESSSSIDPSEQFEMIASAHSHDKTPELEILEPSPSPTLEDMTLKTGTDALGLIRHALLVGDFASAVKLCLQEKKTDIALILAKHSGEELFEKTQRQVLVEHPHEFLSPLLNCIIGGDLPSLVEQCPLSQWKEAMIAVSTYADEDQFPLLLDALGNRLEISTSSGISNACLCYVMSGNLDKFVSCWAKNKKTATSSPKELQDLVEIIVVLQRSLAMAGRMQNTAEGGAVSNYLCHYAALLASQGAAQTAISYLLNATEGDMIKMRQRLHKSLGLSGFSWARQASVEHTSGAFSARNRTVSASSQGSNIRKTSTPHSFQPQQFTPSLQAQQASYASHAPPSNVFNPSVQTSQPTSFMQPPLPAAPIYAPQAQPPTFQPQQPTMMQPQPTAMSATAAPPVAPPGGASISTGGFRRPGPINRYAPINHPGGTNPPSSSNIFQPNQPPSASSQPFNPIPTQSQPSLAFFNPSQPSLNPNTSSSFNPIQPATPYQPSAFNPVNPLNQPGSNDLNNPAVQMGAVVAQTPAAYDVNVPRGWNDPPPLSGARKAKHQQPTSTIDYGVDALNPMVPQPMIPEPPFTGFQPMFGATGGETSNQSMQEAKPSTPLPKAPLPAEHVVIQDVFNGIRQKGLMTTTNQMAKQRFEDLGPKLEVLYDNIRNGQVGPNTLNGLHQIVSAVQASDYHTALQLHSRTVSGGNFSEMARFMPAVKMLLTTCMQCQVVWR